MTPPTSVQTVTAEEALARRFEADAKVGCYTLIKYEHATIIAALRLTSSLTAAEARLRELEAELANLRATSAAPDASIPSQQPLG